MRSSITQRQARWLKSSKPSTQAKHLGIQSGATPPTPSPRPGGTPEHEAGITSRPILARGRKPGGIIPPPKNDTARATILGLLTRRVGCASGKVGNRFPKSAAPVRAPSCGVGPLQGTRSPKKPAARLTGPLAIPPRGLEFLRKIRRNSAIFRIYNARGKKCSRGLPKNQNSGRLSTVGSIPKSIERLALIWDHLPDFIQQTILMLANTNIINQDRSVNI